MNHQALRRGGRWCVRLAAAGAMLGLLAGCSFEKKEFAEDLPEYRADLPDAEWQELAKRLPPVPTEADLPKLVEVQPGLNTSNFRFFVDPRAVRVDPGRIVRMTVVSASDMGAVNISYEALRCGMREMRTIATARPGGTWQHAYNDEWRPVTPDNRTAVQNMLFKGVLCAGSGPASMDDEVLRDRLRYWKRHAYGVEAREGR